ncbi:glycosyl hydrolase family 28 protein [Kribbella sp. NBC_01505]|uniref:glycosyl hydrolase family 28 protein n=1 Tax=Kribbella sp. NBC_01505 TaxID=2903580 RepID=UPI0038701BC9
MSPPALTRLLVCALAVLLLGPLTVLSPLPAHAAPAPLQIYPVQSIYPASPDYRLTVNGQNVPVSDYPGYDIAQFAMGAGEATITVTKVNNTAIGSYFISPAKLNLSGSVSGAAMTFTVTRDEYLIVKLDGRPNLVIAIDPLETNRPADSGTGIFNVRNAPYNAQPGSGYSTAAFQTALNDASAWGGANGRQGVVYVPAGVWTLGTIYLRSNLALYLAPGAVLRYTGERSQYDVHWRKNSQSRDITWFLSTRYSSTNISIYGRGVIDGNGQASLAPSNLGVNLLTPVYTTHFRVDGITFRESSSWAVMPIRSEDVGFTNVKIFNRFDMGENDGIDVMESRQVRVTNAIGIGLDDPFSTKTWAETTDITKNIPGASRPLDDVVFDDLVSWTYCYGLKVGQGVLQNQSNVTFRNAVVHDAAVGIGVHHKYGTGTASSITFDTIDIERLSFSNDNNRTWLALWTGTGPEGTGPISGVRIANVRVRDAGTTAARINGLPGAQITGVQLHRVLMPGSSSYATTLAQMRITNVSENGPITITQ